MMMYGLCIIGGACLGVFMLACCIVASDADDWEDKNFRK